MKSALIARIVIIFTIVVTSIVFIANTALAKNDDNTRPGWGYGDKNHEHTGPPGQSVNPSDSPKPTNTAKPEKTDKPEKTEKPDNTHKPDKTPKP